MTTRSVSFAWTAKVPPRFFRSASRPRSGGVASPRPCSRWAPPYAFGNLQLSAVNAYVKPDNVRSRRAFEKAGYRYRGEEVLGENRAMHYFVGREEVAR